LQVSQTLRRHLSDVEGANGQLPNLDLISTVRFLARKMSIQEEHITLTDKPRTSTPFSVSISSKLAPLFTFMINQATGVPTGDHGIFNMYVERLKL
jgi:hypothetical protein